MRTTLLTVGALLLTSGAAGVLGMPSPWRLVVADLLFITSYELLVMAGWLWHLSDDVREPRA